MKSIVEIVKSGDLKGLRDNLKCSNVNEKDNDGNSFLHIAVMNNDHDIVRFLVINGSDLNGKNEDGNTPLHFSILKNHIGIFKMLLRNGCSINIQNNELESPFMLSIRLGRIDMAKILLTFNVDLTLENIYKENAAFYMSKLDDMTLFEEVLKDYPNMIYSLNSRKNTLLHEAVRRNSISVCKYLISKNIPINYINNEGETALFIAAKANNIELASLLIDHLAFIDIKNKYDESIFDISNDRFLSFIEYKCSNPKYINYFKDYPLHVCAMKNDLVKANQIANSLNLLKVDIFGKKPIDYAKEYNHDKMIKFLHR